MFQSEQVDRRFQAFLRQECDSSFNGRAPVQMSEPEAVWFLEQLALHASYGLFVGTVIYGPFGCPSWLMDVIEELADPRSGLLASLSWMLFSQHFVAATQTGGSSPRAICQN